jgi:rubrerythrin
MSETMNLATALEFAITTEQQGALFYDAMSKKHTDNPELAQLFSILARDEEVHEFQFKKLRKELPAGDGQTLSEADADYLEALAYTRFFSGEREPVQVAEMMSVQDGLRRAYQLEQAAILFYTSLEDSLGASDVLDTIIATEKQHLMKVMQYMITGAKMRGLLDDY